MFAMHSPFDFGCRGASMLGIGCLAAPFNSDSSLLGSCSATRWNDMQRPHEEEEKFRKERDMMKSLY